MPGRKAKDWYWSMRYKAGIASYFELLDAQRESFTASQGELQVRRAWLTAATQLYKALGGESSGSAEVAQGTAGK